MQEFQMFGKFLEILKLLIAILARILFGHFPCRVFSLVSALNSSAASPLFYDFFKGMVHHVMQKNPYLHMSSRKLFRNNFL